MKNVLCLLWVMLVGSVMASAQLTSAHAMVPMKGLLDDPFRMTNWMADHGDSQPWDPIKFFNTGTLNLAITIENITVPKNFQIQQNNCKVLGNWTTLPPLGGCNLYLTYVPDPAWVGYHTTDGWIKVTAVYQNGNDASYKVGLIGFVCGSGETQVQCQSATRTLW